MSYYPPCTKTSAARPAEMRRCSKVGFSLICAYLYRLSSIGSLWGARSREHSSKAEFGSLAYGCPQSSSLSSTSVSLAALPCPARSWVTPGWCLGILVSGPRSGVPQCAKRPGQAAGY